MENDKVVGLGFYKTKPIGLSEYISRRSSKLDYLETEIKTLKKEILNFEGTAEEKKEKEDELLKIQKEYNDLKYKDSKFNTGTIDRIGFYFQDEDEHIIENVKRVLSTRRGERIGNLSFGSDISKLLFLPEIKIDDLIEEIINSLSRCEPRVRVLECTLQGTEWDTVEISLVIQVKRNGKVLKTKLEI